MFAKGEQLPWIGVALLLVAGAVLRVWGLDVYAYSPDDALHIAEAKLGPGREFLLTLAREDTHPPLHYLLLRVLIAFGLDDEALRAGSLIPSLLLIPLLYGLGRRASGRVAGLFAAFLATFSSALVLQAQVIRAYPLELVLIVGALWLVFDHREGHGRGRLAGYGVLMTLAIFTHYSAVIAIAAIGLVRLFGEIRGGNRPAALGLAAVHGLLAITAGLLIWLFASFLLDSQFRNDAVGDWLAVGFPQSRYLASWLGGTLAQLIYFTDPPRWGPGIVLGLLFAVGCWALRGRRFHELVPMFFVASGFNMLLAVFAFYPFSGTRHSLYLIPFVALISGAGFQWCWEKAGGAGFAKGRLGPALFVLCVLLAIANAAHRDLAGGIVGGELPLLREHYDETLEHLMKSTKASELLVGDKQLAYYAWNEGSMSETEQLSDVVGRTRLRGRDFYYFSPTLVMGTATDLARFVESLEEVVPDPRPRSLRFASLGWRSGLLFRLGTPGMAEVDSRPDDQMLRKALVGARTSTFNSGEGAGGGVAFSATWETLRKGLRQTKTRTD